MLEILDWEREREISILEFKSGGLGDGAWHSLRWILWSCLQLTEIQTFIQTFKPDAKLMATRLGQSSKIQNRKPFESKL